MGVDKRGKWQRRPLLLDANKVTLFPDESPLDFGLDKQKQFQRRPLLINGAIQNISGAPVLGALTLNGSLTQGVPASGVTISGALLDETITLGGANAGLTVQGTGTTTRTVTGTPTASGAITATQTSPTASNSPRGPNALGTVAAAAAPAKVALDSKIGFGIDSFSSAATALMPQQPIMSASLGGRAYLVQANTLATSGATYQTYSSAPNIAAMVATGVKVWSMMTSWNDFNTDRTSAQVIADLDTIRVGQRAGGITWMVVGNCPNSFDAKALTAPRAAQRDQYNNIDLPAWVAANSDVILVNLYALASDNTYMVDGLHPNLKGALLYFKAMGDAAAANCFDATSLLSLLSTSRNRVFTSGKDPTFASSAAVVNGTSAVGAGSALVSGSIPANFRFSNLSTTVSWVLTPEARVCHDGVTRNGVRAEPSGTPSANAICSFQTIGNNGTTAPTGSFMEASCNWEVIGPATGVKFPTCINSNNAQSPKRSNDQYLGLDSFKGVVRTETIGALASGSIVAPSWELSVVNGVATSGAFWFSCPSATVYDGSGNVI